MCATEYSYHQKEKNRKTENLAFVAVVLTALTSAIHLNSVFISHASYYHSPFLEAN